MKRRLALSKWTSGYATVASPVELNMMLSDLFQTSSRNWVSSTDPRELVSALREGDRISPAPAQRNADLEVTMLAEVIPGQDSFEFAVPPWALIADIATAVRAPCV
jgi:hypothetical protein